MTPKPGVAGSSSAGPVKAALVSAAFSRPAGPMLRPPRCSGLREQFLPGLFGPPPSLFGPPRKASRPFACPGLGSADGFCESFTPSAPRIHRHLRYSLPRRPLIGYPWEVC